jgi:hypothetical protein
MDLVTREEWGARPYRTPGGATPYAGPRLGVKIHYLGAPYTDRPHGECPAYVRQLQSSHMGGNGWSDIGYSFVVCTHGTVFEGRGLRRRNSANGGTTLNERHYAVCALVGSSGVTEPTAAQLHGLRDAIEYCRAEGPAGSEIKGHRDGYATSCPGDPLHKWVRAGAPRPGPREEEEDMALTEDELRRIALAVHGYRNKAADQASVKAGKGRIPDAYGYLVQNRGAVAALTAQVAALTAAVGKLAQGGGLNAAEIQGAAEAGARAALAELGDALTN